MTALHPLGRRLFVASLLSAACALSASHSAIAATTRWIRQFDLQPSESIRGLAATGQGDVYLGGFTSRVEDDAFNANLLIGKYDVAGNKLWMKQIDDAPVGLTERVNDIAPAGLNRVLVAGRTAANVSGDPADGDDGLVIQVDANGEVSWKRQFGTSGINTTASAIAGTASGDSYAVVFTSENWARYLRKYDAAGELMWNTLITPEEAPPGNVAVDNLGGVYVAGFTRIGMGAGSVAGEFDGYLRKYDTEGNVLWTIQRGSTLSVAADALGNVFVTGTEDHSTAAAPASFLENYAGDGSLQWSRKLDEANGLGGSKIAVDGLGNVFLAGTLDPGPGDQHALVVSYDSGGSLRWTHEIGRSAGATLGGLAADRLGNVFVGGSTAGSLAGPAPPPGTGDAWIALIRHVPGDFDGDDRVTGSDFLAWQQGTSPAPVSAADLEVWKANFASFGQVSGPVIVPEPSEVILCGSAMAFVSMAPRRRRRTLGSSRN